MTNSDNAQRASTDPTSVVPNREPLNFAGQNPEIRRDLARADLDGGLVLAAEDTGAVLVLDPVRRIIAESLDGQLTVDELGADLCEALRFSEAQSSAVLGSLLKDLHDAGFLVGSERVSPRRVFVAVPWDSCAGKRMGLPRAEVFQIEAPDDAFRVACTAHEVLDRLPPELTVTRADEPAWIETIVLRASRGRVAKRVQQIFNNFGDATFRTRDFDTAVEAFGRTIQGRLDLTSGGAYVEGPVLARESLAVLLHPSLVSTCFDLLEDLALEGWTLIPCTINEIVDGALSVPRDVFTSASGDPYEVAGMLQRHSNNRSEACVELLSLARHWDHVHVQALVGMSANMKFARLARHSELSQWLDALKYFTRSAFHS